MQDYELDAWLGSTPATDEQRAALLAASDDATSRYPDDDEASERAFTSAAQIILGDSNIMSVFESGARVRFKCYTMDNSETELHSHSGQLATVLSKIDNPDEAEVGPIHEIVFADGFKTEAFEDELTAVGS